MILSEYVGAGSSTSGRSDYALTTMSHQGFGAWKHHTRGIGENLLFQMGYQHGKGLGSLLLLFCFPLSQHITAMSMAMF